MSIAIANQIDVLEIERLLEIDQEIAPAVVEGFHVHDEGSANWVVRRIIEARQYAQHVKEWAELECRRSQRDEDRLMFMFGRQLEAWVSERIAAMNGRRKSIPLPAGTVGFRHLNTTLVIIDEGAVLDWARQHQPKAIQTKEYLSKTVINEHFAALGELPPGTQVEPEREKFYIR